MTVFLGDTAFYLATLVFGFGIVLIYFAQKENSSLLKVGGYLLTLVGVLGALCTGYYWFKYYFDGHYENPFPNQSQTRMMDNKMMEKMMGQRGIKMGARNMMGGRPMVMKNMNHCMSQMEGKMMNESMMNEMKNCLMSGTNNNKETSN